MSMSVVRRQFNHRLVNRMDLESFEREIRVIRANLKQFEDGKLTIKDLMERFRLKGVLILFNRHID